MKYWVLTSDLKTWRNPRYRSKYGRINIARTSVLLSSKTWRNIRGRKECWSRTTFLRINKKWVRIDIEWYIRFRK